LDTRPAQDLVGHGMTVEESGEGTSTRHTVDVPDGLADLARVGVTFDVDPRFDRLRWFGRGPHENYPDRNRSAIMGVWEASVDDPPYLVPQEFGLRTDTHWLELSDSTSGDVIRIDALDGSVHWSAIRYTAQQLFEAATTTELVVNPRLVVTLDAAHRGLGTASCGPDALDRYRLGAGRYEFGYRISARAG
jgi:beta-galactosidase